MMEDVRVRSAQEFFDEFGRGKLYEQHMLKDQVRKELVEAFRKEIFSLVAMRAKKRFTDIPAEGDPEALRIARNVVKDETKKWKKLVGMFEMYRETSGCIRPDDLTLVPEEGNGEIGFQDGELVTREIPITGDIDGDEVPTQVTDEPAVSGYVAVSEDLSKAYAEDSSTARAENMTINEDGSLHGDTTK